MESGSLKPLQISQHDVSQIEIKTVYQFSKKTKLNRPFDFIQEIYFFIPSSMGINSTTYSKDVFYRALTNYIRLKTPKLLNDNERKEHRIDLLLPLLIEINLGKLEILEKSDSVLNEVRLFGTYINDQIKNIKLLKTKSERKDLLIDISQFIKQYRIIMDQLISKFYSKQIAKPLVNALLYVDEFLTNRFEDCIIELKDCNINCAYLMEDEFYRRDKMGYFQAQKDGDERSKEEYSYRMSLFKKFVSEVLFLKVKRFKREKIFTNFAAALGAMIAALLTALVDPSASTSVSLNFFSGIRHSFPVLIAFIAVFYAIKDRLKDSFTNKVLSWLKPWIPDYNFEICSKNSELIGKCQENVEFIPANRVPMDILNLRNFERKIVLKSDSFEEVLHYQRILRGQQAFHNIHFIKNAFYFKDILRIDMRHFVEKLSDPTHRRQFFSRDLQLQEEIIPKVYHIRMIIKYRSFDSERVRNTYYQVRLILDKNGIKRIEKLHQTAVADGDPLAA